MWRAWWAWLLLGRRVGACLDVESEWILLSNSSELSEDVMVDFVADTGDGFKSTFSIARAVANDLYLGNSTLRRGDSLIIGGDIAYPEGTIDLLMEKFVFPFRLAFDWNVLGSAEARVLLLDRAKASLMVDWMDPTRVSTLLLHTIQTVIGNHPGSDFRRFSMKKTEAMTALRSRSYSQHSFVGNASQQQHLMPTMLAVLGNHDAIDGGEGFQRLFLENAAIGGWAIRQNRSYWAAKATSSWVVIGVHDQQAAGANPDIDPEQWYYLSKQLACSAMRLNIVLVVHAPFWLQSKRLGLRMAELFKDITTYNHSLRLILSGDQHIYAHYSAATGTSDGGNNGACPELIISGGGGAFTHSTMHLASTLTHLDLPGCAFTLKQAYPSKLDSIALHFDAVFAVLTRRVVLALGMLFAVLIEYHWRQTLLESKDRDWWLLQVWLSRRAINRQGQIQIIVPPRYQLWMSLTALGGVMPLAWSLFINTKPFVSLVAAFGSGKAACVACALPSLVKGWDQVASCLQDGGGVNGEEQTTAMHLSWQLLTRSQLLFCLCVLLTYFGPPKRSARKWEGAIAMYLAGNKPALLPPLFASSSYATTSTTTILPKGVPESLMHTREGQELVRLIQTDYSHWEKFRVIRDKESKLTYDWLVKIVIGAGALMYLQFFLFGSSGLVVLGSVFAGFLACLHSILHPLGSLALTMFVTSLWLVCRASLLSQEQSLLPMLTLVGSGAVCLAHWVAAAMDFLDIFDWVRWKPWSFWLTATMGGKEANRMFGGGLPPPHQLSLRWWWYWQRWVPKKSGFSLLSSVALLLQKGVTLSFVLVLTAAVCSAWFGAEVFPDDPFFSAARNEHFKHFVKMQFTSSGGLVAHPITVDTAVAWNGQQFEIPRNLSANGLFQVASIVSGQYGRLDPVQI